jgi:hypothetical protein
MMSRLSRPRIVAGLAAVIVAAGAATALGAHLGVAAAPTASPNRQDLAKALLDHGQARFATQGLQRALAMTAGEDLSRGRQAPEAGAGLAGTQATGGATALVRLGVANVLVNNPAVDRFQVDQTTQSETSLAVVGSKIAIGFNDSQQALFRLTDGLDLSGYAYSADGGKKFTDGGTLPNPLNFVNLGDPWLTSDRAGRMYYATLTYGGNVGNLEVAASRSTDGGKTWTQPKLASPNNDSIFYVGDKEAITAGRDPNLASRDNLYLAWDDFSAQGGSAFNGLPVARSTDHGTTWSLHYAAKIVSNPNSCSFGQFIGAQPLVDPATGVLYVAAEKITVTDPNCTGGTATFSEVIYKSTDGGITFGTAVTVSTVKPATPTGALKLGPGQFMRTIEFPTLAMRGARMWTAWNDGRSGHSHILLASSTNRGATWSTHAVTGGTGDEVQPALSVDATGLHLAYYQRNANNTLDTALADSTDNGAHFTAKAITSQSFPGVHTVPQFDPQIGFGYMGDYITNVSAAGHQYLAWGDNRDRITNFTHPHGRNDPDVYFTRR